MTPPLQIWTYRGLFLLIAATAVTIKLLPIDIEGSALPGPDLIMALTFAWLMRHPALVPLALIAAVVLLADFLLQRPPGLWTALVVLVTEAIRRRRLTMVEVPFLTEWAAFAAIMLGLLLLNRIALWLLVVDLAPPGPVLLHGFVTVLIYPAVAALSHYVLRVPKLAPGEMELD